MVAFCYTSSGKLFVTTAGHMQSRAGGGRGLEVPRSCTPTVLGAHQPLRAGGGHQASECGGHA